MIVECPQCKAKARVDESRLGRQGAKVRCGKCRTVYPVTAPPRDDEEEFGSDKTSLYTADTITGEMLANGDFGGKSRAKAVIGEDSDSTSVADPAMLAKLRQDSDSDSTSVADPAMVAKLRRQEGAARPAPPATPPRSKDDDDDATVVGDSAALFSKPATPAPRQPPQRQAKPPSVPSKAPEPEADAFTAPVVRVAPVADAPVEPTRSLKRPSATDLAGGNSPSAPAPKAPTPAANRPSPAPAAPPAPSRPAPVSAPSYPPLEPGDSTRAVEPRSTLLASASAPHLQRRGRVWGGLAVGVLLVGMGVYVMGERLFLALQQQMGVLPVISIEGSAAGAGVTFAGVRSLLYPGPEGHTILLLTGEVRTSSAPPPGSGLDAVFELRDRSGKVTQASSAPLGLPLDLVEVVRIADRNAWDSLVHAEQRRHTGTTFLAPNSSTAFHVAMLDPPTPLSDYAQVVHLAPTTPPPPEPVVPPPVPTEPPQSATPAPAPPAPPSAKDKLHGGKGGKKVKVPHHHSAHHAED